MSVEDPKPPGPAPPKRPKYEKQVEDVQQPNLGPDPDFDWEYWSNLDDPTPLKQASPNGIGLENQVAHVHVGQLSPWPSSGSSADSDFQYMDSDISSQLKPASPNEINQAHLVQADSGPSNPGYSDPQLADEDLKTWKPPILESSDVHASSSPPPPGFEHGWTNVVLRPAPNPASSTANPRPLIEPSGPSSTAAMQGSWENRFNAAWDDVFSNKGNDGMNMLLRALLSLGEYGSDHESTGAHAPQPNPNPNPRPSTEPEVANLRLPNLVGSPKDSDSEPEDDEVVLGPPSSPDPELHQPSSADSEPEPVDLLAAIYAAKGKAKVAGTGRDVGNATQRELQPEPAERSLDPGGGKFLSLSSAFCLPSNIQYILIDPF
jgi:hypothetical protein